MTKRGLVHHGIAWLLSAALLLTNGLPISVEHAHHISGDLQHHRHDGQMGRSQPPGPYVDWHSALASVDDVTDHLHLLWLGWEFTVPAPQDQAPGTHAATSVELLARLETLGEADATAADGWAEFDASADDATLFADVFYRDAAADAFIQAVSQARPLAALPLCDTALHARSGVQLT